MNNAKGYITCFVLGALIGCIGYSNIYRTQVDIQKKIQVHREDYISDLEKTNYIANQKNFYLGMALAKNHIPVPKMNILVENEEDNRIIK